MEDQGIAGAARRRTPRPARGPLRWATRSIRVEHVVHRHRLGAGDPAGARAGRARPACGPIARSRPSPRCRHGCSCSVAGRSGWRCRRRSRAWGRLWLSSRAREHVLAREPEPLGRARGRGPQRRRHRDMPGRARHPPPCVRATSTCWSSPTARTCAATGFWWPPVGGPAPTGSAWRAWASSRGRQRDRGRLTHERRGRRLGDRRRDRDLAAHVRGQVPGPGGGSEHPGPPLPGRLRGRAAGRVHRSPGGSVGEAEGSSPPRSRSPRCPRVHYSRAYDERPGFLTLFRRRPPDRAYALGPDAGEWLQQATLAIRAASPRADPRRDPALSHLLRGVPVGLAELGAGVPAAA